MPNENPNLTPMMKQYLELKSKYQDTILFYRLGDFYEMFFQDAIESSKILGITLTARSKGENKIPMCGVPYHSARNYINKLIASGKKVAICEQLSDPNLPGIVERNVVKIITPGTILDETVLDEKENNFTLAIFPDFSIAYADLSTGEFQTVQKNKMEDLFIEIEKINPHEIIFPHEKGQSIRQELEKNFQKTSKQITLNSFENAAPTVQDFLVAYFENSQKRTLNHLKVETKAEYEPTMPLSETTVRNLELFQTLSENKKYGSLLWVLDQTLTPMGGRLLRNFIGNPLLSVNKISERYDAITELKNKHQLLLNLRDELKNIFDIERTITRLSIGPGSARDLIAIKNSFVILPKLKVFLQDLHSPLLKNLNQNLSDHDQLTQTIERTITTEPPVAINEGGMIQMGVNTELDELKNIVNNAKAYLLNLEKEEIQKTGISTLKIRFNKIFGYYIEISKGQAKNAPEHYQRKQTLVNAERFVTDELKIAEEKIMGAEEKMIQLESQIFQEIRQQVLRELSFIQTTAQQIALLDVLTTFAINAIEKNYIRPNLNHEGKIEITAGRHPVIEEVQSRNGFITNDTNLNNHTHQFLLITGPNMGGKSTYLRQVALISLMAQIGSFVPAEGANLCIIDQIFTRIGASDNLVRGQSTFMVEMQETANILKNATEKSLIILDEIGRGTSTYDGLSIAWTLMEYIHNKLKAKTLFATHYHELIQVAENLSQAQNYAVQVIENAEKGVIFLYKILPGGVDRSYGIEVAKLAGIPEEIILQAQKILLLLESTEQKTPEVTHDQLNIFSEERSHQKIKPNHLEQKLSEIDLNNLTPIQALQALADLKNEHL